MSISRKEVNGYFHGPVTVGHGNSADYVVAHGTRQQQRGKNPSATYKGITNPQEALEEAQTDIRSRELWDDEPQHGLGRVGIKHYPAEWEGLDFKGFDENIDFVGIWGLVGVVHVYGDEPHTPINVRDLTHPNDDGTIDLYRPIVRQ